MRVGDDTFYFRFLQGLLRNRSVQSDALRSLADGKRVRSVSDDPAGAGVALALRARLARLEGLDRSAEAARADLATLDRVLGETFNVLSAARTEAMAGASGVEGVGDPIRAAQIESLRDQLLSLANTEQNGRYLFGGTETLDPPFASDGSYAGNDDEASASIDVDRQVGTTLSGNRVFIDGGDLFARLDDLAAALRDGRLDDVAAATTDLDGDLDRIAEIRADVGIRLREIDSAIERHGDRALELATRIAEIENVALEEVIVQIQATSNVSEALSAAAARTLGRSLFDFLG